MAQRQHLKDHFIEQRIFHNRSIVAIFFTLILFSVLIFRLFFLQINSHEHYTTLSQNNRVSIQAIPPTRGLIYDRNGIILAENLPSYTLQIIPEQAGDIDALLTQLALLVNLREIDIKKFQKEVRRKRRFEGIPLRFRLTDEEVAIVSVNLHRLPGVEIKAQLSRFYPYGKETAHVVGYVGRINERELKQLPVTNYSGTNHTGKLGVEKSYEALLHGQVGYQKVETNVRGRVLRVLERNNPVPGNDLYLNLDINLQKVAIEAFDNKRGALVAINPENGQLLAMVSMPDYDANLFVNGIDSKTYKELNTSWERPLFNRTILGNYPPGSTTKPFFALAGLELNVIQLDHEIFCPGYYQLKGKAHKYRDWKKWGHGKTDITKSIVQSCDVFYYDLAFQMGIDKMHKYMTAFGFGKKSGIDILGERSGLMPSKEWKKRARKQVWFPGETVIAGIGQGYVLVTPIQLALGTATLANGGKHFQPQLVNSIQRKADLFPRRVSPQVIRNIHITREDNWLAVYHGMEQVIHGARGTARRLNKPDLRYKIAGKTGTAQVFSVAQDATYKEDELEERLKDHALFISFAPADNPKIAIAVVVENGGHGGSVAAPIAGKVIEAYLNQFSDEQLKMPAEKSAPEKPNKIQHKPVNVDPDKTAAIQHNGHEHG
ncbi:MAG: penicillin-binding protein 2 [gamma proteobacterium symbiont of Bathyaustriella thionipta]|nr:penicillin-binding protein 2 [gamma proteobacterium symbiont of Bathyaustriella thionipta]MCU7948606.1 penicillin-binding protein 2 [gamma proteobacterium symbiont of Bathyaustriella thionipta]MCU7952889.1 penicillin-binding protein 2 [gamma proteobacterium symbiont of Bathyaustriella thionipta]MCU7955143.1 penicillin-binding protein 2 [gamma proteobacterium symbiont of Bathyaustriella thionipta]